MGVRGEGLVAENVCVCVDVCLREVKFVYWNNPKRRTFGSPGRSLTSKLVWVTC